MRKISSLPWYEPRFGKQVQHSSMITTAGKAVSGTARKTTTKSLSKAPTGFYNDLASHPHYPPWESDNMSQDTSRPFTSGQIPVNFHEYHFRTSYPQQGSQQPNTSGSMFRSSYQESSLFGQSFNKLEPGDSGEGAVGGTRVWEHTGLGSLLNTNKSDKTLMGDGTRFTIMCYNILAPGLQKQHPELYRNCSREALDWNIRRHVLWEEMLFYAPDIVCLQEVEVDQFYLFWEPKFSEYGFRGVYKRKTGDKEDGCAIFYHTSKFLLIDKLEVDFLQSHSPLLNRDNIGLLVKLETRSVVKRQKMIVGTTHLLFNPKRPDVRLAQVQLLLAELERFAFCGYNKAGKSSYYPMLLTGDFNSKPYSEVTKLITEGQLKYMDENGELIKLLAKRNVNCLIPRHLGISDTCQHYRVLLHRHRRWKNQRSNNFEVDLKTQESLVDIFPYLDTRIQGVRPSSEAQVIYPRGEVIQAVVDRRMRAESHYPSLTTSRTEGYEASQGIMPMGNHTPSNVPSPTPGNSSSDIVGTPPLVPLQTEFEKFEEEVMEELNQCGVQCEFASGVLSHPLQFRDIHAGRLDRKDGETLNGVTTKQSGWTCVDYIFQSMTYHPQYRKLVEGNLKLIRRLGLYTRNECKNIDIPNEHHPSDHFPLVAEFLLRS